MDLPRCCTFIPITGILTFSLFGCRATHTQTETVKIAQDTTAQTQNYSAPVSENAAYDETAYPEDRPFLKPGKPGEVIISVIYNLHDWATGKDENTIVPIVRYAGGQYESFNQYADYDDSIDLSTSEIKPFFDMYKKHTIWLDGKPNGSLTIDSIRTEPLACFNFLVGKSDDKFKEKDLKTILKKYGYSDGLITDSSRTSTMFIGTANLKKTKSASRKTTDLSKPVINQLREKMITRLMEYEKYSFIPDSIKVFDQFGLDIDNDGVTENFASLFYEDSIRQAGYTIGFHIKNEKPDTFFNYGGYLEYGSWGTGLTFLEAIDINGDNIPELIFEDDGYESTDFVIYEYREGKLRQVFFGGGWGC